MELDYSLRGLLSALFRQKGKIILTGAAIMVLGCAYLAAMPLVYESNGSLLVKFGQDARPSVSVDGTRRAAEASSSEREEIIQSNIGIIYSNDLLRSVVVQFGADRLYPGIAETLVGADTPEGSAVKKLQGGDLIAQSSSRNNIIDLTVRNKDAAVAGSFATLLIENFIRRQAEIYNKPQTGFLQQQVEEAGIKLAAAQQALQAFKARTGISSLDEEMTQLMRQKSDMSGIAYEAVTRAQADLAALEARYAEMRATYRPNSPAALRMQQSIAAARNEVEQRQADLNIAGVQSSSLSSKLQMIDERLGYLEQNRADYNELAQRVNIEEENYKFYQQRGEEARANDILNQQNITRISVIDTPFVPTQPANRQRKLLFIAVLMAAGVAGLSVALLFEILDDRVRTPAQLSSRLRLPVMATLNLKGA